MKHINKANQVIDFLDKQPGKTWRLPQKTIAEKLDMSLSDVSNALKLLYEEGKIKKGGSIPGCRGKTFIVYLLDSNHLLDPAVTIDEVGTASKDEDAKFRSEQLNKVREYREKLSEERELRTRLASERDNLKRQLEFKDVEINRLQAEVNKLLMAPSKPSTYRMRELVAEEDMHVLESLMRSKPGFYKESDRELGVG